MLKHLIIHTIFATLTLATPCLALPLSPGDRVKVMIPEGTEFSGIFEVNSI